MWTFWAILRRELLKMVISFPYLWNLNSSLVIFLSIKYGWEFTKTINRGIIWTNGKKIQHKTQNNKIITWEDELRRCCCKFLISGSITDWDKQKILWTILWLTQFTQITQIIINSRWIWKRRELWDWFGRIGILFRDGWIREYWRNWSVN